MHVSIHGLSVALTVYIYHCLLVSTTLLGVSCQGGCSSRKVYTRLLERLASAHCCLFLQGAYQHLGFLLLLTSHTCPIWALTWWIRSVLEGPLNFLMFPAFLEGSLRSGQKIFPRCPFRMSCWFFSSARYSRRYLLFYPGCWYPPDHLSEVSLGSSSSLKGYLFYWGPYYSWRDWSASVRNFLGSLFPKFLSRCSATNRVSWGIFPDIRWDYFGGRISSSLCRWGNN